MPGKMVGHELRAGPRPRKAFRSALALGLAGWLCGGPLAAQEAFLGAAALRDTPRFPADPGPSTALEVFLDFAMVLQITGDVAAIVVGNAAIADASVVAPGTIALTGKAVGTTNVVILQPDGVVLSEMRIQVIARKPGTVTVRRAILASSYACTSASCQRSDGGTDSASGSSATP